MVRRVSSAARSLRCESWFCHFGFVGQINLFMVCKVELVMSLTSYGGCESSVSSKTLGTVFQCIVSDQLMLIIVLNKFS